MAYAYSPSSLYDPSYTPVTPRRKRRSKSVPPPSNSLPSSETTAEFRSNRAWTSSQYIRGLSVGPSYQQKAYDTVRRQYFVPQNIPPRRTLSNAYNLRPPPSYHHTMARLGSTTGLKTQDPYYYASRDYLSRTGSYYGTYGRPRQYRAPQSRVSQFYPGPSEDIYSPGYGSNRYSRSPAKRRPLSQSYSPVILESQDDLEVAKPLKTKEHQAEVKPPSPPVRAVVGKTDVSKDEGVTDIEQKASDIKSVVSPPVRAVQLGETDVSTDHGADVTDLEQRVEDAKDVVSPPVRAVQMGQADIAQGQAADFTDFEELTEIAVDLDFNPHPVRAVQLGEAELANDSMNEVAELNNNPSDEPQAQKATIIEDPQAEFAQQSES
ncbi:uncharacterized protein LOC135154800 [Lytechinus pictus]|uniref:uncharacterized protein LOC135154800 n=1 Tax=Lytechinus pictus TaxID=7653 RepID=UPI0030B9B475